MARRRFITEELLSDEGINSLSDGAEKFFYRLLTISDDFGFTPSDPFKLQKLLGIPDRRARKVIDWLGEILQAKLGRMVTYDGKLYFLFKSKTFDRIQTYLLNNRTQSEYLDLKSPEVDKLRLEAESQELPEGSGTFRTYIASREKKVKRGDKSVREGGRVYAKWDADTKKLIIPPELHEDLCADYSRELIEREIPKMERWLKRNKPKKDYNKFVSNWLNRAEGERQNGRSHGGGSKAGGATTREDLKRTLDDMEREGTEPKGPSG